MPFSADAIANFFLDQAEASHLLLTPMKVQKLVYFAHAWSLALRDAPLIGEQVEAWRFGPVIPSLYRKLKGFGNQPITCRVEKIVRVGGDRMTFKRITPTIESEADSPEKLRETRAFLLHIWKVFSPYSAIQLSNMTHTPGSPWDQVVQKWHGDPPKGTDISQDIIRDYYATPKQGV